MGAYHLVFSLHHHLEGIPRNQELRPRKVGCSLSWCPGWRFRAAKAPAASTVLPPFALENWPEIGGNTSFYSFIQRLLCTYVVPGSGLGIEAIKIIYVSWTQVAHRRQGIQSVFQFMYRIRMKMTSECISKGWSVGGKDDNHFSVLENKEFMIGQEKILYLELWNHKPSSFAIYATDLGAYFQRAADFFFTCFMYLLALH